MNDHEHIVNFFAVEQFGNMFPYAIIYRVGYSLERFIYAITLLF